MPDLGYQIPLPQHLFACTVHNGAHIRDPGRLPRECATDRECATAVQNHSLAKAKPIPEFQKFVFVIVRFRENGIL